MVELMRIIEKWKRNYKLQIFASQAPFIWRKVIPEKEPVTLPAESPLTIVYKREKLTPSGFSVAFKSTGRSGSAGGRAPARTLSAGGTNF